MVSSGTQCHEDRRLAPPPPANGKHSQDRGGREWGEEREGRDWALEGVGIAADPNPLPKLGDPTLVSSALYLLAHRYKTNETHWPYSRVMWGKGENCSLP